MRVAVLIHYESDFADLDGWDESETRCSANWEKKNRWGVQLCWVPFLCGSRWRWCKENQVRRCEQERYVQWRFLTPCSHACRVSSPLFCDLCAVVALNNHSAGVSVLLLGNPPPPFIFCSLVHSPFILSPSCHFNNHTAVRAAPSASVPLDQTLFSTCDVFCSDYSELALNI